MVWSIHAKVRSRTFWVPFPKRAENSPLKIVGNTPPGLFFPLRGTGGIFTKPLIPAYVSWVSVLVNQLTVFLILVIIQKKIHEMVAVHLQITNPVKLYPEWGLSFPSICAVCLLNLIDSDFVSVRNVNCTLWSQLTHLGRKKYFKTHVEQEVWWSKTTKWWLSLMNTVI